MKPLFAVKTTERKCIDRFVFMDCIGGGGGGGDGGGGGGGGTCGGDGGVGDGGGCCCVHSCECGHACMRTCVRGREHACTLDVSHNYPC